MSGKYAVVGNPIGHTKSPLIHLGFAKETGQDIDYVAIEAPVGGFNEVVDKFRRKGGLGLNITAPFKLDAFAYCTDLHERARLAGAVNAMKFEVDRVTGENFDGRRPYQRYHTQSRPLDEGAPGGTARRGRRGTRRCAAVP